MKTRLFILAVIAVALTFSCNNTQTEKVYPDLGYLVITPDSLLSEEDLNIKIKLLDLFINNLKAINGNQIKVDISKEEFLKSGLPEEYYDKVMKDIDDSNVAMMADSLGLYSGLDLEKSIQDAKDHLEKLKQK